MREKFYNCTNNWFGLDQIQQLTISFSLRRLVDNVGCFLVFVLVVEFIPARATLSRNVSKTMRNETILPNFKL